MDHASLEAALGQMSKNTVCEIIEGLETALVFLRNLINFPNETKYHKILQTNLHYQERLGSLAGATELMAAMGYQPQGCYLQLDQQALPSEGDRADVLSKMEKTLVEKLDKARASFEAMPFRLGSSHSFTVVKGAASHGAIGRRLDMEDDEIIADCLLGSPNHAFFGLYDGHGGRETVDFVAKTLHVNLSQYLAQNPKASMLEGFREAYAITDGQLRRRNILRSGTTAVTCVVHQAGREAARTLYTANVGDSRAVLSRGGKAVRLTIDHKATLPEEERRIRAAGGFIARNRVNGVLAISRALGDHMLKRNDIVSVVPHTVETALTSEDDFLLLACDGVWDVMSDQEAVDFVLSRVAELEEDEEEHQSETAKTHARHARLETACRMLVKEALDRRSLDNITCLLVQLCVTAVSRAAALRVG